MGPVACAKKCDERIFRGDSFAMRRRICPESCVLEQLDSALQAHPVVTALLDQPGFPAKQETDG